MGGHAKVAVGIVVLGVIGFLAWQFVQPMLSRDEQASVSDARDRKGNINIGMDGWVGYFPMCSPHMKTRLHRSGYTLKCVDDEADYRDRFDKLERGEYQFAVATVDSYLLNGDRFDYPGPIVAVIDESKGGDAIVAWRDAAPSLEALKTNSTLRVAYTPNSPSEHLMKAVSTHFEVALLRNKANLVKANGSEDAFTKLRDRAVDVAVLWEPEVTRALGDDQIVRLLDTAETRQLIVDILVAGRDVARTDPDLTLTFLRDYFETLKYYRDNRNALIDDLQAHYDVPNKTASALLDGVAWSTLSENAGRWYGVDGQSFQDHALVATIEAALAVLLEHEDFRRNPIPNEDPYRLINSSFVETLFQRFANTGGFAQTNTPAALRFDALSEQAWGRLEEVGSLKARQIAFASGTAELTVAGRQELAQLVKDIAHYPNFRIEVRGHSGQRGDPQANQALSRERADAVLNHLRDAHQLEVNRLRAVGFGGLRPLPRQPGESDRAYGYRLPRVEVALVRETI